jgi:uncharacterized protein (DUF1697 family)
MPAYIGLLRGVNVGGAAPVRMDELRERLEGLGFKDVRTLLQSGNVVFRSMINRRSIIEGRIEAELARAGGLRTNCFVRTAVEWRDVIAHNPFPREASTDPAHLMVLALKERPVPEAWEGLRQGITGREVVLAGTDHGYAVYPDGLGRSRLTLDRIERALGTRGTLRNWNTVTKLGSLVGD